MHCKTAVNATTKKCVCSSSINERNAQQKRGRNFFTRRWITLVDMSLTAMHTEKSGA